MPTYDNSVEGFWSFNQTLEDDTANNDFSPDAGLASYSSFQHYNLITDSIDTKYGLVLNKKFSAGNSFDFNVSGSYNCNVSFWYFSSSILGFLRHASTRKFTPRIYPILAKANSTISNGIETVTQGEWIISEAGFSDSKNCIQLLICGDGTTPTNSIISTPFEYNQLVHVYILLNRVGSFGTAQIFINGVPGAITQISGNLSTVGTANIRINDVGHGYVSHKNTSSDSFISDLVIRTNIENNAVKSFRFGNSYLIDSSLIQSKHSFLGIGYTQPTTITTNQIHTDGGNIYITRSNGELLKGSRPIWDNEFNYTNPDSIQFLNVSKTDDNRIAQWTQDGLKLKGTSVRI